MSDDFDKLMNIFATGSIREKHDVLRRLIALKMHNKASKDALFQDGVEHIAKVAADQFCSDDDRLLAVSLLSRIWSIVRSRRDEYEKIITEALKSELPSPFALMDADDRAYIGKSCTLANYAWIPNYVSKAAVFEESGEQARGTFLIALLKSTKSLDIALNLLKVHLSIFIPETEAPGNTVTKRLRRILSALRTAIAEIGPESGDKPGEILHDLVKETFSGVPPSTDEQAVMEASEEIAAVINEIIRLRFSLATQSSTYKALSYARKLLDESGWERLSRKSESIKHVGRSISESILMLARQGIPADDLVSCLNATTGSSKKSRDVLSALAEKPGLSSAIKNWLINGVYETPEDNNASPGESQVMNESIFIADLLVDSLRYRSSEQIGRKTILGEMEILNPNLSQEVKRLLNYGLGLCDSIESLAKSRGLRICGTIGSETDYSPAEHELIAPGSNTRRVRIIRPPVDQIRKDGVAIIIRKGLVEPLR